jgi:hypothetical protein
MPFFIWLSQPPFPPPHVLEVTGDVNKGGSRGGKSSNDLETGLTGCDGGIDEPPREECFFFSLSPRPKSRGS